MTTILTLAGIAMLAVGCWHVWHATGPADGREWWDYD